jgi:hypothetical protein
MKDAAKVVAKGSISTLLVGVLFVIVSAALTPAPMPKLTVAQQRIKDTYDPNDAFTRKAIKAHLIPPGSFPNCNSRNQVIGYWKPDESSSGVHHVR